MYNRGLVTPWEMAVDQQDPPKHQPDTAKTSFWRAVISVIQASFGVQSHKNRERDFQDLENGRFGPYVMAGVLFTVVFVLSLILVVKVVLG